MRARKVVWCIDETKRHHSKFIVALVRSKSYFVYVFFPKLYFLVTVCSEVQL